MRIADSCLTAERLRSLVHYSETLGLFTRLVDVRKYKAGTAAKGTLSHGYVRVSVGGRSYAAHRLAWLWMTGNWPKQDIDHIDGDRANNRWANLRDVSRSMNLENMHQAKSHNKSTGLLGAHLHPQTGNYTSRIQVRGKDVYLGSFATPEAAHTAYIAAKRIHHEGNTL